MEKLRWLIAGILGKYFGKKYCWGDLVLWSLSGDYSLREIKKPSKCGYCGNCMTVKEWENYLDNLEKCG